MGGLDFVEVSDLRDDIFENEHDVVSGCEI